MICNKCNHTLPDDSEFCQYCGDKVVVAENTTSENFEVTTEINDINRKSKFKKPKKISIKYCSRCGAVIDNTTKKCTGCKKQYFKGLSKKSIVWLVFIIVLLVSLVCNIFQQIRIEDLLDDMTNTEQTGSATQNNSSDWKESAKKSLESRGYYDKSDDEVIEYNKSNDKIIDYNNSQTYEYYEDTAEKCILPSCNNDAKMNSFYCNIHECLKVGCHERKANDYCQYCQLHKCTVPSCNSGQAYNSSYCYIHK